jgi:hypothetical protein
MTCLSFYELIQGGGKRKQYVKRTDRTRREGEEKEEQGDEEDEEVLDMI